MSKQIKKNHANVRTTFLCPNCGNELPASIVFNRLMKFIRCPYCKSSYHKSEIVKEKER